MTWVKVCGVRRVTDIEAAEEAGADAIGLVLVPGSPRQVSVEEAAGLVRKASITTFLLTFDASPVEVLDLAAFTGVDGVQPYGRYAAASAAAAERAGLEVLRPFKVTDLGDLAAVPQGQVLLVDNPGAALPGGSGEAFDWELLPALGRRWVLAGGLGPDNVGDAVARLQPWGVDASSRLESSPGVKDPSLIRRFVEAAK